MKLSLLLLIALSFPAEARMFLFGDTRVEILDFPKARISIGSSCVHGQALANCAAMRALKTVSFDATTRSRGSRPNPGALICDEQVKGVVIVGIESTTQNENSFCKLADGSIIDNGTLIYYGMQNDKRRQATRKH